MVEHCCRITSTVLGWHLEPRLTFNYSLLADMQYFFQMHLCREERLCWTWQKRFCQASIKSSNWVSLIRIASGWQVTAMGDTALSALSYRRDASRLQSKFLAWQI